MAEHKPSDGGSFWSESRNRIQTVAYLTPEEHAFLLELSEGAEIPMTVIISKAIQALKNERVKNMVLGVKET